MQQDDSPTREIPLAAPAAHPRKGDEELVGGAACGASIAGPLEMLIKTSAAAIAQRSTPACAAADGEGGEASA